MAADHDRDTVLQPGPIPGADDRVGPRAGLSEPRGTSAGKSTIVCGFVDHLGGAVLDLDSYCFDRSALPPHERSRLNYDEPAAIDAALLVEHLAWLGRSEPFVDASPDLRLIRRVRRDVTEQAHTADHPYSWFAKISHSSRDMSCRGNLVHSLLQEDKRTPMTSTHPPATNCQRTLSARPRRRNRATSRQPSR